MEKVIEYYKSFQVVLMPEGKIWKAAAFFPHYKNKTKVEGVDIGTAFSNIKLEIDRIIGANLPEFRVEIEKKHIEYLFKCNAANLGVGFIRNKHRVSNCYSCKRTVDNSYDIECNSCGWIVCARCGACGCGVGYAGRANA